MKNALFWAIKPYSQMRVNRSFGTYNKQKFVCGLHHLSSFFDFLSDPEDGGDKFLRSICWLSPDYTAYIPEIRILHNHLCENTKCNV
jgi:hypothetical protein